MKVIGTTRRGLVIHGESENISQDDSITVSLLDLTNTQNDTSHANIQPNKNLKSLKVPVVIQDGEKLQEIVHTSVQILSTRILSQKEEGSDETDGDSTSMGVKSTFYLLTLVKKLELRKASNDEATKENSQPVYSATLLLLQEEELDSNASSNSKSEPKIVEEVKITENQQKELRVHVLPTCNSDEADSDCVTEDSSSPISFKSRLVVLSLEECIMVYHIETLPYSSSQAKIEILCSECAAKSFWWGQWVPQHQFLAFSHKRKLQQSSFDDEHAETTTTTKTMLSVLQFHEKFPRETVLNVPLDLVPNKTRLQHLANLVDDPLVLSESTIEMKILAHKSGAVYLFVMNPGNVEENILSYNVNMLHHNKNINVEISLQHVEKEILPLRVDVALYYNDQYVVVVGWPLFVHLLHIGTSHEPSHHIIFDYHSVIQSPSRFICLYPNDTREAEKIIKPLSFVFEDRSVQNLELNSAFLLPLFRKADVTFKIAAMHFLLVHLNDINVAKRILYDEGKDSGNLHLKKIYQEFLIGNAYVQTKKQLMPNLEPFLQLVPYCPCPEKEVVYEAEKGLSIKVMPNVSEVTTMLLTPSQRVFPHNITDVWTSLWEVHHRLTKSNRFSHANIAEKLLLSLQCYKPEALSRASTPMSPSSPMICASLGDIAGLFGRRTTELQLPFIEHESCTANKQEYVFSINLRELSMHLLKERKEWPLHGHTVAGKYVCALADTARLLCHLVCLTVHLQPTKTRDKGFRLIDSLNWETRLKLFILLEHYSLALGSLACPLPQGYTPFFAYLGYRVLRFDQFLWHVRSGTFDLQIDLVKTIMADMKDSDEENIAKKLHLMSLLPKSRANRVLNSWSHPMSVCLRARQHSSDLLSGVVSQQRKSLYATHKKKKGPEQPAKDRRVSPLDTFFQLLTAKASVSDIDLGLLTEATMISMEDEKF